MGTPDTSLLSSGQTRKATLTMRRFAIVCCMVAAVAAFPEPQSQSFRDRIRNALLNSDQNPCGAGVRPSICVCPDGTSFTPGEDGTSFFLEHSHHVVPLVLPPVHVLMEH